MAATHLRLGTRGSPLALVQAHMVADALKASPDNRVEAVEIVVIKTTGDQVTDRALADIGGKGLFTKEIEDGLLEGTLHLAVHSAKDMPTVLPEGLTLAGYMPREDVRDVFISRVAEGFDALPEGACVGTASLRRQALIKRVRPDLKVEVFRGNVQTRLRKLDERVVDATMLALAGLKRLGQADVATEVLDTERFPPALGQGAVCVETRADDADTLEALAPILDEATAICLNAERGFLAALDGNCRTPIAGLARTDGDRFDMAGLVARPDGSEVVDTTCAGAAAEAAAIAYETGRVLRERLGPGFFESWSH